MHRNGETSRTDDQAQPEDRSRPGTTGPAGPAAPADRQPGVTAADVTAGQSGDPIVSGPGGDPLAAGLAGHPLTPVRDDDADAAPGEIRGADDDPAGAGLHAVPPAEGQWVAGTRGPGSASGNGGPGAASTAVAEDASTATGQPEVPGPGEAPEPPEPSGTAAGAPLLTDQAGLRERWLRIQSGFIDDPRASVTEAAGFVGEITTTIVSAVQERERGLRGAWDGNGDADTESLRNALREYRTFFELLTRL